MDDKKTLDKLAVCLKDRNWRLNNLYYIRDANGNNVKFHPNKVQQYIIDNIWYNNVIPKARQHGVTTLFSILWLDEALFSWKSGVIVAHTAKNAEEIFDTKVQYAWDRLPKFIKDQYQLDTNNAKTLKFKRGENESSISVSTSVRSGTVQRLLITELGTLDQKYPEKSNEIMTGALNAVHTGQITVIESTSKGAFGNFYEICKVARDKELAGQELTPMDYKIFFFPWYEQPTYQLPGKFSISTELQNYFQNLELKNNIKLNQEQKNWYAKKLETQADSMKQEFPSTFEEVFQANVEGAYYGKWIDRVRAENRIAFVPYDPTLTVDTWWDLGINDDTVIIFTQQNGMEVRIIDCISGSGEGLLYYAKQLAAKGYHYGSHNAPHDIEVREMSSGKSRREFAASLPDGMAIYFQIVPNIPVSDGIEAARNILPHCWFNEDKTNTLINKLSEYRKEWDDKLATFKDKPLHNDASHYADAFRYMAVGLRQIGNLSKIDPEILEYYSQGHSGNFDKFEPLKIF